MTIFEQNQIYNTLSSRCVETDSQLYRYYRKTCTMAPTILRV